MLREGHVLCVDCRGQGEISARNAFGFVTKTCSHCMGAKDVPADKAYCFYFGVWERTYLGHYLWSPQGSKLSYVNRATPDFPFSLFDLDSDQFIPSWDTTQGKARLTHKMGWTLLGFHDYSGDSRPGSKSVFVLEGTHDFARAIEIAKRRFPHVWSRITFEVSE